MVLSLASSSAHATKDFLRAFLFFPPLWARLFLRAACEFGAVLIASDVDCVKSKVSVGRWFSFVPDLGGTVAISQWQLNAAN